MEDANVLFVYENLMGDSLRGPETENSKRCYELLDEI